MVSEKASVGFFFFFWGGGSNTPVSTSAFLGFGRRRFVGLACQVVEGAQESLTPEEKVRMPDLGVLNPGSLVFWLQVGSLWGKGLEKVLERRFSVVSWVANSFIFWGGEKGQVVSLCFVQNGARL